MLKQNLTYALRVLRKTPGVTLTILLTLGIGIGAVTALFTIGYVSILTALPYPNSQQLIYVSSKVKSFHNSVAAADYLDWKAQNHTFQEMSAYTGTSFNVSTGDQPENINGSRATPGYYTLLAGKSAFSLGRDFLPEEAVAGRDHVLILSYSLWKRFGASNNIIGSDIKIDGQPYTVVGVTAAGVLDDRAPLLMAPLVFASDQINHDFHTFYVIGRLKPGVTQEQAQADMDSVAANIARANPKTNQGWGVILDPMKKTRGDQATPAFLLMLGAVVFVLLMICVNIANLLLARGMGRQKEIAIRTALGATRKVIFVQMITESLVLALTGGLLGAALDYALLRFATIKSPDVPLIMAQSGYVRSLAVVVTIGVTALCGLFFGYAPAWLAARVDPNASLKEGHSGTNANRQKLRRALVSGEFALALVLLTGAGLAIHSFSNRMHTDPGIKTDHTVVFSLSPSSSQSKEPDHLRAYYRQLTAGIQSVPGVMSVSVSVANPMYGGSFGMPFTIAGKPAFNDPSLRPSTSVDLVTPEYFATYGISMARGRTFHSGDIAGSLPVVIVNEDFARKFLSGADPLTQRITMERLVPGAAKLDSAVDWQIVGVMHNARGTQKEDYPMLLIPFAQIPWPSTTIAVRTSSDPGAMTKSISAAVHAIDPLVAIRNPMTMDHLLDRAIQGDMVVMGTCSGFAIAALLLAMIGIYGVMSFAVTQRSQEIAVRMALGAGRRHILSLVMKEGATLAAAGLAIGLVGAYFVSRMMQSFLYDVAKIDYPVLAAVSAVLLTAALAACFLPAKRATAVNPMQSLRSE